MVAYNVIAFYDMHAVKNVKNDICKHKIYKNTVAANYVSEFLGYTKRSPIK